jgi:hypothetical protein
MVSQPTVPRQTASSRPLPWRAALVYDGA